MSVGRIGFPVALLSLLSFSFKLPLVLCSNKHLSTFLSLFFLFLKNSGGFGRCKRQEFTLWDLAFIFHTATHIH